MQMRDGSSPPRSRLLLTVAEALGVLFVVLGVYSLIQGRSLEAEGLIHEKRSAFSHIKVMAKGTLRYLFFVRDNGEVALESVVDLKRPERLILTYTRIMFSSLLVKPTQSDALLVGLGGGSMVNFIHCFFPDVRLDVVEIDPEIIRIAREYFGLTVGGRTRVVPEDGFDFIQRGDRVYDVIYLDAFLKPSEQTDATGVPRKMKQKEFYSMVKRRLKRDGLLVVNINAHAETRDDLAVIRASFPRTYLFSDEQNQAMVVIGSMSERRVTAEEMHRAADRLDVQGRFGFPFAKVADLYQEDERDPEEAR
jgi:spermidine synthase